MAGIDKMWLRGNDALEFAKYIADNEQDIIDETGYDPYESIAVMYSEALGGTYLSHYVKLDFIPEYGHQLRTLFPEAIDAYLWENCEIEAVQEQLHEQYEDNNPPQYGTDKQ